MCSSALSHVFRCSVTCVLLFCHMCSAVLSHVFRCSVTCVLLCSAVLFRCSVRCVPLFCHMCFAVLSHVLRCSVTCVPSAVLSHVFRPLSCHMCFVRCPVTCVPSAILSQVFRPLLCHMCSVRCHMCSTVLSHAFRCSVICVPPQISSTMGSSCFFKSLPHPISPLNLPGWCWARIKQLALIGSSSSLHSEACKALGGSDGVVHSTISLAAICMRAVAKEQIRTAVFPISVVMCSAVLSHVFRCSVTCVPLFCHMCVRQVFHRPGRNYWDAKSRKN